MRRILILLPLVLLLAGCTLTMHQWPADGDVDIGDPPFVRLLTDLTIYAPTANGMPFSYQTFTPGDKVLFDFNGGADQYGQPTGLSDPIRWAITEVRFQLEGKTELDTVFWPSNTFAIPYLDNSPVIFIGWTAPVENISGLPLPLKPLSGYPWDSCMDIHSAEVHVGPLSLYEGPGTVGTLSATASAETLKIDLVCPIMPVDGSYTVDEWGATPTEGVDVKDGEGRVIGKSVIHYVTEPGVYVVRWEATEGDDADEWEFTVPASWFHKTGSWPINIGPSGTCLIEEWLA